MLAQAPPATALSGPIALLSGARPICTERVTMKRAALLLALLFAGCLDSSSQSSTPPMPAVFGGWQAEFARGTVEVTPVNLGFVFQFPTVPNSVNYVVKQPSGPLAGVITAYVNITSQAAQYFYAFNASNTCPGSANLSLYIERQGDQGALPDYASYRFWSTASLTLQDGNQQLSVPLDPTQWINVNGQQDPTGFAAALAEPMAEGVTFGGGCFKGHGVGLSIGQSRFTLVDFTVNLSVPRR
jgi:hypothetical protein